MMLCILRKLGLIIFSCRERHKSNIKVVCLGIILFAAMMMGQVNATPQDQYPFADMQQQQQFHQLLKQIRCVVCQNQDIADSNADLAKDLRQRIYQFVQQGQSDEEILQFLTTRYGEFILFQPPLTKTTVLLWFAPFILLLFALVGLFYQRGRKHV